MTSASAKREDIAGLVLAGGRSERFGGHTKALQRLAGRALIEYALRPLQGLKHIAVNANAEREALAAFGYEIVRDGFAQAGPLGGVHAGLAWAASLEPVPTWLAVAPVDMPFLPADWVFQLSAAGEGCAIRLAASASDFSPVAGLWRLDQQGPLEAALLRGIRKMTDYEASQKTCRVPLAAGQDPLFNVNTPLALAEAERLLAGTR